MVQTVEWCRQQQGTHLYQLPHRQQLAHLIANVHEPLLHVRRRGVSITNPDPDGVQQYRPCELFHALGLCNAK